MELVEYVREDSIPAPDTFPEVNYSYEDLAAFAVEENIKQILPGDIPVYREELLWSLDIPDMAEPGEITRSGDSIIIGYITATENFVVADFYPNGDYEIYAKPLENGGDEEMICVQERKGGVIDNYLLRRTSSAVRGHAAAAMGAGRIALLCILPVLAAVIFRRRT